MFINLKCLLTKGFVVALLSFLSPQLLAEPQKTGRSDLQVLVEKLGQIDTFSGAFVQESVDQAGQRIQASKGELKAQRPGLFYWHTKEPLEQIIYSNATEVTVYDPDLDQATVQNVTAHSQTTPAILFSGDVERIGDLFDVAYREISEDISQFVLVPKTKDSLFERLKIRFDGQHLKSMQISDALGQISSLSFIYSEVNLTFPENTFSADLPEGTDIIRDIPLDAEPTTSSTSP